MSDRVLDDLRKALRREMLVGDWNRARSGDGAGDLVVSEFTRGCGEEMACGITFVIARWHSMVRPGHGVSRTYRSPLTVSTVVWVEYPAATALLAKLGGVAGPPLVERFLDRAVADPSVGVTGVPTLAAVGGAAKELALRAHDRSRRIVERYSTVDGLVAEWQGTPTVELELEREWVPVTLAAAGRGDEALVALRGYVRRSGPNAVDERYRLFADALRSHLSAQGS
jgi:hypothetical protein